MMPKSTATSLPVVVDEQVARMHVGVEEAVAQAWRRKVWITRAAERRQVEARGVERGAVGERHAVDPFHGQHVAGGAVPVDRRHAEIGIVLGVLRHLRERGRLEPQVHLDRDRAARASRPPRSGAAAAPRPTSARPCGAAKMKASRSARKRRSTPGRSTLTATGPRAVRRRDLGAMHLRDRGGGDRRAERARRPRASGLPSAASTAAPPRPAGTAPSGPAALSRSRASAAPTTSGRVARNWPSLT